MRGGCLLRGVLPLLLWGAASGLTAQEQCSQATCDTVAQMLVCEAFGIGMPRICAKYLLGSQLDCPRYPHDILDAPYICRDYYGELPVLSTLIGADYRQRPVESIEAVVSALRGVKGAREEGKCLAENVMDVLTATGPMGYDTFEELCAVDCFHAYQIRLNNMFIKCSEAPFVTSESPMVDLPPVSIPGLDAPPLPDIDTIGPAQLEMCAYNTATNVTCMDAAPSSDDEMDFRCPYPEPMLPAVKSALCQQFQPLGCCMGTLVTMGQQMGDSIIPPCIFQILSTCPEPVTANNFCPTGLMTNVSTMVVTYQFEQTVPGLSVLPNMYNETEVRKLMAAFADCFATLPISADMNTVTGFSYKDADGNPITNYLQVGQAKTATYTLQLSLIASKSPLLLGTIHPFVPTDVFAAMLATRYGLGDAVEAKCVGAEAKAFIVPMQYEEDAAMFSAAPSMLALFVLLLGTWRTFFF